MSETQSFELCGFQRTSRNGFALPCFSQVGGSNSWFIAETEISADPSSRIARFIPYESDGIEMLSGHGDIIVEPGDAWHDVFIWGRDIFVGKRYQISLDMGEFVEGLMASNPVTGFDMLYDSATNDLDIARQTFQWLEKRLARNVAKNSYRELVLARIAKLRFRRFAFEVRDLCELHDSEVRVVPGIESDFGLDISQRAQRALEEHGNFDRIYSELAALAGAASLSFESAETCKERKRNRPTPTFDRKTPRKLAEFNTFREALDYAARGHRGLNFYDMRGSLETPYPFSSLRHDAVQFASKLRGLGVGQGDRVAIIAETCPEFSALFVASILLGAVPAALPLPTTFGSRSGYVDQIDAMLQAFDPVAVLYPDTLSDIVSGSSLKGSISFQNWDHLSAVDEVVGSFPDCAADDVCYVQFSSGSTRFPEAIAISHSALLSNIRALGKTHELRDSDRIISWLPWYHDMGLVGGLLGPIAGQTSTDLLKTEHFARRPLAWLDLISRNAGTSISYSPTFGYDICSRRISSQSNVAERFDLSRWRIAGNGADMIRPDVMQKFVNAFADAGFAASAFSPSYGLAEATLAVTVMPPGEGIRVEMVDMKKLEGVGLGRSGEAKYRAIVNCGKPIDGMKTEIRAHGGKLGDHEIGEIWCSGPSLMTGYLTSQRNSDVGITDGWLYTGDVGYMADGYLFVVGRAKDMIVINGSNYWPQDIEWAIEQLPGFNHGDIAAFSVETEDGEEVVAVLVHCRVSEPEERVKLRDQIADKVRMSLGMNCVIELVPPRTLPRTSSGKLSRAKAKKLYVSGQIQPISLAA